MGPSSYKLSCPPARCAHPQPLPLRMAQHFRQVMNTHVSTRPRYTPSPLNSTIPYPQSSPLSTVLAYGRFPASARMILALRIHLISAVQGHKCGRCSSMLIPDVVARRSVEFITDFEQGEYCERYVPTRGGSEMERIRQCAASNGWTQGMDLSLGIVVSGWRIMRGRLWKML
jgi:hypothetical protein